MALGKKKDSVSSWLKENREFVSLSALEKKIGCPGATLNKVVTGERNLADQWVEPLYIQLKKMKINV